jgi:hypothetical protein
MRRNGSLAGAFSLLFLGWLFLSRELDSEAAWSLANPLMWVGFGIVCAVLGMIEGLVMPRSEARLGPKIAKVLGRSRRSAEYRGGWFSGLWAVMGLALAGLLVLAVRNEVAPFWIQERGIGELWPLILLYLGVGQLLGFGVDLVTRVLGMTRRLGGLL